jgi:hypothetical protein
VSGRGEIIIRGWGGWLSGPSLTTPPRRSLPGLWRLIQATERGWLIEYHAGLCWSAERAEGTAVRYLCAHSLDELADAIGRAERP